MSELKTRGITEILGERIDQQVIHGFDAEHDMYHSKQELIRAAMFCLMVALKPENMPKPEDRMFVDAWWPFNDYGVTGTTDAIQENIEHKKSTPEQLAVAGAFIAAEIDRLDP